MNDESTDGCPQCGAPRPRKAPEGLCPRCLLVGAAATESASSPQRHAPPALETVAAAFPQLEVIGLVGQGGMGCVFKARQPQLNRFVALKVLPEALARDAAFAERFAHEARALAALNHPNIVTVHDFGRANGFFFLLMEFVDGVDLRQALRAGRFTPEQALAIVPPICDALQYAHERGIVHRDIKPENLLLEKSGRVKIADFGIAKILEGAAANPGADGNRGIGGEPGDSTPEELTPARGPNPSLAAGTPRYMAPEQRGDPARTDHRADIYSLGVVLYELLTGEPPEDKLQPPSRKVQIDVRLDEVVLRALEKEPARRYSTAREFKTSIETVAAAGARTESAPAPATRLVNGSSRRYSRVVPGLLLAGTLGTLVFLALFTGHKVKLRERAAAVARVIEREQALHQDSAAATGANGGSKRQRFEARKDMAARTSWTVMDKPSFLNPDGWAVMARLTIGGVAKIRFPDEAQRRCDIRLIDGNDDGITVRIDDLARNSTMTLSLLRDRPGEITLDGEGFRVLFPTAYVAPGQPETSPFAQVIVTPVHREDSSKDASTDPASAGATTEVKSAVLDPRSVVDQWLGHVKANRMQPMWNLTTRESGGAGSVDLRNTWQFDRIKAGTLAWTSNAAMVVTTRFNDNAGRERQLAFSLVLREGKWLIRDHWNVPVEVAGSRLDGFVTGSGARFDVRRTDIVGRWHSIALPPAAFEFREDGHFALSYRTTGGGRTNVTGTWTLEGDQLGYQTTAGEVTGRVVNVSEDFFQLRFSDGNLGGYHRADEGYRPTTGEGTPHFAPVLEVALGTNEFFSFKKGQVQPAKPESGFVSLLHEGGQLYLGIEEIHAIRVPKDEGAELWNTKSAAALVRDYQQLGFALLPSERFSRTAVESGELPLTFLLPGSGFLQVTEVNADASEVKLRYKLVQP